jgi:CubicO group peptidase (beta-lactamase class C family)
MKRIVTWCVLLAGCLLTRPAQAVAWVARHGLTGAQYQSEFNRWTAAPYGLRPTCVSAYQEGGQARLAVVFQKVSGPDWSAAHLMTAAQFDQANTGLDAQHFQPVFLSCVNIGGTRYYNALWEYQPRVETITRLGLTRSGLASQNLTLAASGYALNYVTTFTDGAADGYAAIWVRGASSTEVRYALTGPAFQTAFNDLTSQGYRLVDTTTSMEGSTERYTGVFRRPFGSAWYSYAAVSAANYQGETWNAYYQGFRPTFVSVFNENGAPRFNAVWTDNGGPGSAVTQPIANALQSYMNTNGIPGLSLAIARQGRLVYAKGFGLADQSAGEWVHPHHRFRIASVSKPITATAIMRLRDEGAISSLNQTVFGSAALLGTQYGTLAYSSGEKAITLSHLLHHASGWTTDGVLWNNAYGTDHAAILGWQLDNAGLSYTPGFGYQYQNIDYIAAGRVIEQLSGKTYEQFVQDDVLAPCGITQMELGNQTLAGRKANEVVYYQPGGGDPYVTISPRRMDANGGWIARPLDLLLLLRRIDGSDANTDIISSARFADMHTGSLSNATYGTGLILGASWWGHNGAMDGTISFLVHRNDGFDFAVTCNTRPAKDNFCFTLKGAIDTLLNSIPTSGWPEYDLFPSYNLAFDGWLSAQFTADVVNEPGLKADFWGAAADPDGDNIPNAVEAYFSLDPLHLSVAPCKPYHVGTDLAVRWQRSILASTHGVQLGTQISPQLTNPLWSTGPDVQTANVRNPVGFITLETRLPANQPMMFQRFTASTP